MLVERQKWFDIYRVQCLSITIYPGLLKGISMIINSNVTRKGTVEVVVSFKIPTLEYRVQFSEARTVCNFFAFLRNVNIICYCHKEKY